MLGNFALSQDFSLKCWDTSHCHKTIPFKCWDTPHCPKTSHLSVGTFRTVLLRPPTQVLGHFALSQDHSTQVLGHFVLSQDPSTQVLGHFVLSHPSTQVLGHFTLSQDYLLKYLDSSYCPQASSFQCWYSRISSSSVLGHLDHYPRYHHLSPSVKNSPKPNLTDQKFLPNGPL